MTNIEERNIVQNILGGAGTALNTWYQLDPGWTIDIPVGEFKLRAETLMRHFTNAGTAVCSLVLSTATTPAGVNSSTIIMGIRGDSFGTATEPGRYQNYEMELGRYISTGVTAQLFIRPGNILGASTLSELALANNLNGSFAQGVLSAERIK